jgi:hypothetical protein
MTKVEARYELTKPVDETLLDAIGRLHGVYGLQGVKLSPKMDELTVLYDASRLRLDDVDRTLHGAGLPARRR